MRNGALRSIPKCMTAWEAAPGWWLLFGLEEDTEHQGYEGQQRQAEPEVGHVVLPLRLGQAVCQSWLQAHKQHTGGEGDARSDIVKNFGIIHLLDKEKEEEGWR